MSQQRRAARMARRWMILGVVLVGLVWPAASARSQDAQPNLRLLTPPDAESPTRVSIDLYDLQIFSISETEEVFRVSGRLELRWLDPRQEFDPQQVGAAVLEYQGESAVEQLEDEVWWPDLEFVDAVGPRERLSVNLTRFLDGEIWYRERFDVHIKQDFYLAAFPFDEHEISFRLEPFTYGGSFVELVPAEDGEAPISWEPSEWYVGDPQTEIDPGVSHVCEGAGGEGDAGAAQPSPGGCPDSGACPGGGRCVAEAGIPSATVTIPIKRVSRHYVADVVVPLVLIVLIIGSVFFMDLELTHLGDRLGLAVTGLLTVVAFDFVASGSLPKLWYSTALDRVITASYVFTALAIGVLVLADRWHLGEGASRDRSGTLTRASRWLFPLAYLACVAILILAA